MLDAIHESPRRRAAACAVAAFLSLVACAPDDTPDYATGGSGPSISPSVDPHSYSRPDEAVVTHLTLDLTADFDARVLTGSATLDIDVAPGATELVLDTRGLDVTSVHRISESGDEPVEYELAAADPLLGRALLIPITADTRSVRVDYSSSPDAAALQWLTGEQTSSGKPFLLSQSQAILARTWVPCQDTPGVRMTYSATIQAPEGLMAVMSASNPTEPSPDGRYTFEMPQPIPSYLLAIAIGDLEFRAIDERSGVYAEPQVVEAAAWEFADVPAMMTAFEELYGPYEWGRYDLLVLPPSFPFGGMENPRLTFATPTIIAGDRSLVALVAHELAHSWSGNLVTNATWDDFWLNEGTTTYLTYRIMEELYGTDYATMIEALGRQDLEGTLADLGRGADDTRLRLDLAGRDPDDGMNDVAYEKGSTFFRTLEHEVGRERFDAFLKDYFAEFAFRPLDSETFERYVRDHLLDAEAVDRVRLQEWIYGPDLPHNAWTPESAEFDRVEAQIAALSQGAAPAALDTQGWTTHHWLHFLRQLPEDTTPAQLATLDATFGFNDSGNSEIQCAWFERAIAAGHEDAYPALEEFLLRVGRRKFLKPLYTALARTPEGAEWAREVYARARSGYHSVSSNTIDEILGWSNG